MLCTTLGFYGSSMFNFHIHIQLSIEYALHSSYLYNIHKGQLDNQHLGHARKFYKVWTCGMLVVSLNTGGNTTTGQASRVFYSDPAIRQRLVDMCPLEFRDTYKKILFTSKNFLIRRNKAEDHMGGTSQAVKRL